RSWQAICRRSGAPVFVHLEARSFGESVDVPGVAAERATTGPFIAAAVGTVLSGLFAGRIAGRAGRRSRLRRSRRSTRFRLSAFRLCRPARRFLPVRLLVDLLGRLRRMCRPSGMGAMGALVCGSRRLLLRLCPLRRSGSRVEQTAEQAGLLM